MNSRNITRRARLGTALAALAMAVGTVGTATPALAQAGARTYKPSGQVLLSIGEGQVVSMDRGVADVWVSAPDVADVHVSNTRQLNLFGKAPGEATIIATAANGSIVYATKVRVSQNITSVDDVLRDAMPQSNIRVRNIGQMALLTGTVASPEEATQAERLVTMMLNPGVDVTAGGACKICVINRLATATPLQVNLKVRIAEVNRTLVKSFGVNLLSNRNGGFALGRGDPGTVSFTPGTFDPVTGNISGPIDPVTGALPGQSSVKFNQIAGGTTLALFGKVLGLNVLGTLDLLENDGLVSTLAEPNLTALSGETASFLAGGEFPVPISTALGSVAIEYKQYGVGLAFTPIVLADGRISMRVRPEVSELSNEGSVKLNNFIVPALTTRRAETTVELGSGQSFMIAGLLRNRNINNVEKAPFLGDIPVLGSLFRSTAYRRDETELVIIITPYLVRPTSGQLTVPTDGYRSPGFIEQNFLGQTFAGKSGHRDPTAVAAPSAAPAPGLVAPTVGGSAGAVASPGFKL